MRGTVNTFYRGSNPLNALLSIHFPIFLTLFLYYIVVKYYKYKKGIYSGSNSDAYTIAIKTDKPLSLISLDCSH